jgi:hypothetical protein
MKCARVRDEIKACVDGELGPIARRRVARHIARCPECRLEEEATMDLTGKLHGVEQRAAPTGLHERVMANVECVPMSSRPKRGFRLVHALGIAASLVVLAAIVSPAFMRAREAGRAASHMKAVGGPDIGRNGFAVPSEAPAAKSDQEGYAPGGGEAAPAAAPPALQSPAGGRLPRAEQGRVAGGLLIIRTANLSLEVKDFQRAYDQAVSICESVGGYVTNSSAEAVEATPTSGTVEIRVPAEAFDRALLRLGKLGVVRSRNLTGEDVTGEVVDLESRLRNKRAEEQQYLEIMNRARRVADIVTVSNELYRVRGEIEETQGRLKYLKSAAAMSAINLSLDENEKAKPLPASSIGRALSSAWASLTRTANVLAVIAVWLGVYSPLWLLPLAIVLYVRKRAAAAAR